MKKWLKLVFCSVANFTSPTDRNLLVARFNRIDISLVTEEGLQPIKEIALYGKIEIMKVFRPKVRDFILMNEFYYWFNFYYFVLEQG